MKRSSFCSPLFKLVALFLALEAGAALRPKHEERTGKIRLDGERGSESFEHQGSELLLVWHQGEIESSAACGMLLKTWDELPKGAVSPIPTTHALTHQAITNCNQYPCGVKLAADEVAELSKIGKDPAVRHRRFRELVDARVRARTTRAYDYATRVADLESVYLRMGLSPFETKTPSVRWTESRVLPLDEWAGDRFGVKVWPTWQVMEWERLSTPTRRLIRVQDLYSAHYFDRWAEWHEVDCEKKRWFLSVWIEIDELKKGGLAVFFGGGMIRSASREYGHRYLDAAAKALGLTKP